MNTSPTNYDLLESYHGYLWAIAYPREYFLQCVDELVLHNGQHVFLEPQSLKPRTMPSSRKVRVQTPLGSLRWGIWRFPGGGFTTGTRQQWS